LFDGGDSNLYGYGLGDPVNRIDPSGLDCPPSLFEEIRQKFLESLIVRGTVFLGEGPGVEVSGTLSNTGATLRVGAGAVLQFPPGLGGAIAVGLASGEPPAGVTGSVSASGGAVVIGGSARGTASESGIQTAAIAGPGIGARVTLTVGYTFGTTFDQPLANPGGAAPQ
jgi:hypothetical protein